MTTAITKKKHITSVFYNEQILINSILKIHCKTNIELDPMFNKGNFYKNDVVKSPLLKYDINGDLYNIPKGDATNLLNLKSNSINTMILDPPFLFEIRKRKNKNKCVERYTIIKGFNELEILYKKILKESFRVLKTNGILIFKCQDYTDVKTTLTHCYVWSWSNEIGFYNKDLAILIKPNKISNFNLKQRHLRKVHSYFFVLQKKKRKIK